MFSLNQNGNVAFENCGKQTTKLNLARTNFCSYQLARLIFCTKCAIISTVSNDDWKDHNTKKHTAPKLDFTFKCTLCYEECKDFTPNDNKKTIKLAVLLR